MNRCGISSSASTTATGRSTCDRPASSNGQLAPVAYPTWPFINRISASTPWSAIAIRSRAPISARMRAQFGSSGMSMTLMLNAQKPSDVAADDAHGVLGTDRVDLVEAQAVNHERGAHVGVPVVTDLAFRVAFEHVPVGGQDVLGVLQGRWDPGDSPLEPADTQPGVPVENAAENVLGEHLPE